MGFSLKGFLHKPLSGGFTGGPGKWTEKLGSMLYAPGATENRSGPSRVTDEVGKFLGGKGRYRHPFGRGFSKTFLADDLGVFILPGIGQKNYVPRFLPKADQANTNFKNLFENKAARTVGIAIASYYTAGAISGAVSGTAATEAGAASTAGAEAGAGSTIATEAGSNIPAFTAEGGLSGSTGTSGSFFGESATALNTAAPAAGSNVPAFTAQGASSTSFFGSEAAVSNVPAFTAQGTASGSYFGTETLAGNTPASEPGLWDKLVAAAKYTGEVAAGTAATQTVARLLAPKPAVSDGGGYYGGGEPMIIMGGGSGGGGTAGDGAGLFGDDGTGSGSTSWPAIALGLLVVAAIGLLLVKGVRK